MKQKWVGVLYFLASMIGMLASAEETRAGMVGSYILFIAAVLSFFPSRKWTLWFPVIGSGVLTCLFVPLEIRNAIYHRDVLFETLLSGAVNTGLVGLVLLSLVVSIGRLKK